MPALSAEAVIETLTLARASSEKCPDVDERKEVLQNMLQFAACEAAPELFKSIVAEMGVGSMAKDSPFNAVYTVFDMIKSSKGSGKQLHEYLGSFEKLLIRYDSNPGVMPSPILDQTREALLLEMKTHICLGYFVGARSDSNSYMTGGEGSLAAFESSINQLFPIGVPISGSVEIVAAAEKTRSLLDEIVTLYASNDKAPPKTRKALLLKAGKLLSKFLEIHDWEKFVTATRLYVSNLLYIVFNGPSLLAAVRGKDKFLGGSCCGMGPLRSIRYNMLMGMYKDVGGTLQAWEHITNKSENDGNDMLTNVLRRASDRRARVKQAKARGSYIEEENLDEFSEKDDTEIYGDQKWDDNMTPMKSPGSPESMKRSYYEQDDIELMASARKMRRRPVLWTKQENEALMKGVELFGAGSWAKILNEYSAIFSPQQRTSVSLKDRWRNLEISKNRKAKSE